MTFAFYKESALATFIWEREVNSILDCNGG